MPLKWKDKRLIAVQNTELTDLPAEVWKDIPDFPGYQLSSYGRVKSLGRPVAYSNGVTANRSPRIRKLTISKIKKESPTSSVQMSLCREGQIFSFSVARYVYHLFVKNIDLKDRSRTVLKKDGDSLNCHYKNLELEVPKVPGKQFLDAIKKQEVKKGKQTLLNLSTESLQGEKWITLPGYDDKYQLSNFGRVKSLGRYIPYSDGKVVFHKEKINKPSLKVSVRSKNKFDVSVILMKDGSFITLSRVRLVYNYFVMPFDMSDKGLLIIHKDDNDLNYYYKNLELKTASKTRSDSIKRIGRKNYFKEKQKKVQQYDREGKWLRTFDSIQSASIATGISLSRISNAIYRRQLQDKNYYWSTENKVKQLNLSVIRAKEVGYLKRIQREVVQLSLSGKVLKTYPSLSIATKAMGLKSLNSIGQVCKGQTQSSMGYKWRYKDGKRSGARNKGDRLIHQYSLEGYFIRSHSSIPEAARSVNTVRSAVENAARLKYKTAKGYYWRTGASKKNKY